VKYCISSQFLPVPELMPFRLTQQFVNLMQPLRESGLIQSIMVHSLRAYSAEPDLLLNTMDVFVKEPSLDWKVTITPAAGVPFNIGFLTVAVWTADKRGKDILKECNWEMDILNVLQAECMVWIWFVFVVQ